MLFSIFDHLKNIKEHIGAILSRFYNSVVLRAFQELFLSFWAIYVIEFLKIYFVVYLPMLSCYVLAVTMKSHSYCDFSVLHLFLFRQHFLECYRESYANWVLNAFGPLY